MNFLGKTNSGHLDTNIGISYKLYIIFIFIFCDGDLDTAIKFLKHIIYIWGINTYNTIKCREIYDKNSSVYILCFKLIWNTLRSNNKFDDEILNAWRDYHYDIKASLERHFDKNKDKYFIYKIIQNYLHMTSNRLGINNVDEKIVIFLIHQSFLEYK